MSKDSLFYILEAMPNPYAADGKRLTKVFGTTSFFRYPALQKNLIDYLSSKQKPYTRILVVPGSVGMEANSLSILAQKDGYLSMPGRLSIDSMDISPAFTRKAEEGFYSKGDIPALYAGYFRDAATGKALHAEDLKGEERANEAAFVCNAIKSRTRFINADMLDYQITEKYDAVICLTLLGYFSGFQRAYLEKLKTLSSDIVVTNQLDALPCDPGQEDHPFKDYRRLDENWQAFCDVKRPPRDIVRAYIYGYDIDKPGPYNSPVIVFSPK